MEWLAFASAPMLHQCASRYGRSYRQKRPIFLSQADCFDEIKRTILSSGRISTPVNRTSYQEEWKARRSFCPQEVVFLLARIACKGRLALIHECTRGFSCL